MALTVAVVAIGLALFGSLDQTSRRDASLHAGIGAAGAPNAANRPARSRATHRAARPRTAASTSPSLTVTPASAAALTLRTGLSRALRRARLGGSGVGVLVYDLSDHTELYGLDPTVKRPPASVEKLWTTTALMDRLGPHARLHTTLLGAGRQRHSVWHGDLYLRGDGDPTFGDPQFNRVWNEGYGPTATQLVEQLRSHGIRRVTGLVYADESLFDRRRGGLMTDYLADVPDFGGQLSALTYDHGTTAPRYDPATFAARELVLTMRGSHIAARASTHAARTPRAARLLGIVDSPPLSVMTRLMDVPSDDLFAELFAKQLGVRFGRGGTIADGAHVIAQTIAADYDLHPRILDGSGLSRDDRSSPLEVVDLLRDLYRTKVGDELSASLPTVGVNGTVQSIGVRTAAARRCLAKTGTLNYVTNLAGYCAARGGHELAFALFVDGPDNGTAIVLESKMIAVIARY